MVDVNISKDCLKIQSKRLFPKCSTASQMQAKQSIRELQTSKLTQIADFTDYQKCIMFAVAFKCVMNIRK